jgi:predicted permease
MDLKSISTLAIYILTPALVFRTFYSMELNDQYLLMAVFSVLLLFILIVINKVYAKIRNYPQEVESGLILGTVFMNAGNYGTPIILFAYGETGFSYAVIFLALQSIIMNFFGIYYAARGKSGIRLAIQSVLKMPLTYASVLAIWLNLFALRIPDNLFAAVDLVSQATIPVVMLILGMQLAELNLGKLDWDKILYGVTVRMFLSPAIACILVILLPIDPLLQKVLIVATAMPTAVNTTMYALQFNAVPQLVSSITITTTLVSVITVSALLILLG